MQHYSVASKENLARAQKALSRVLGVEVRDIEDTSHAILRQPTLHKLLTHPIGEDGAMKWQGLGKKPLRSALRKLAGLPESVKGQHSNGDGDDSESEDDDLEEALSDAAHRAKPTILTPKIVGALAAALVDDEGKSLHIPSSNLPVPWGGVVSRTPCLLEGKSHAERSPSSVT